MNRLVTAILIVLAMNAVVVGVDAFLFAAIWWGLLCLVVVVVTTFLDYPLIGWPASAFLAVAAAISLKFIAGSTFSEILAGVFFVAFEAIAFVAIYEVMAMWGTKEQTPI